MGRKVLFILALICGLIAAGSAYLYLESINKVSVPELRPLVVVKTALPARSVIQADQLTVKSVPLQGYPQGGSKEIKSVAGSVALIPLNPGDPVLDPMIQRQSALEGSQSSSSPTTSSPVTSSKLIVPEGKRAISIPIGLVSGIGYAVKPGDHIDVLATIEVKVADEKGAADKSQIITALVAQDVLVLNTGETTVADKSKAESKFYTLALSVPQALAVTLASEKGSLRLLLRNPANKEIREDQAVSPNIFLDYNYSKRFQ